MKPLGFTLTQRDALWNKPRSQRLMARRCAGPVIGEIMRTFSHLALAALLSFSLVGSGCAGRYLQGEVVHSDSKIRNTPENRSVIELMELYQTSVETLDNAALKGLVSRDYYENGGTTHTTDDDYGYEGIANLFDVLTMHVQETRLSVKVRDIRVYGERADVIFEYAYTMLYEVGDARRWQTERDVNRIQLQREDGEWRIVSGL